jgi:HTH-type transcriptional regulator / antitoxin HigA
MAIEQQGWRPDWTVAPGEILLEALEERGMSQSELARRMGRPTKTINEIVNAKTAITPETAIQLERTLGIEASFWNQLETLYRGHLARAQAEQELESGIDWADRFPIQDLERRNLIPRGVGKTERVAALLVYFGVASVAAWNNHWLDPQASFRRSSAFEASPEATAAWLRWGEVEAAKVETQVFNARRLREVIREIRGLTRGGDIYQAIVRAQALLVTAGVILLITPEFKNTHISGVARWLTPDKALVQLSARFKTSDHLWFSLLHELAHLLERKRSDHFDFETDPVDNDEDEAAADRFARDTLIDPEAFTEFTSSGIFTEQSIRGFAREQQIAPGLVVGRLQRESLVERSHFNDLKKKIDLAGTS